MSRKPNLLFPVKSVSYVFDRSEMSKLLSILNHSDDSEGTNACILRCFITPSEMFNIFQNENLRFRIFDLTGFV